MEKLLRHGLITVQPESREHTREKGAFMMIRFRLMLWVGLSLAGLLSASGRADTFDVRKYGAVGDGKTIDSPADDGIVLKSSYALGFARATENVAITNCQVTGYDQGTFLDGTFQRRMQQAPDRDGPTGRIKCGTESNGGFKNIAISNCIFDHCRGLALETVDGGLLEDISITNITMREIVNSPIFVLNDVKGAEFNNVKAQAVAEAPTFILKNVDRFATHQCKPVADTKLDHIEQKEL
jgi:polygalacturonase